MASLIHLVSYLPSVSGMPEDTVQNTVSILNGPDTYTPSEVTAACNLFRDFYIVPAAAAVQDMGFYLSESLDRSANACSIRAYFDDDFESDTPFGSPIETVNFTLTAPSAGSPFPEEVAMVISYNASLIDVPVTEPNPNPPPATRRPAQRRRGRLFLGPLMAICGFETGGHIRPTPQFRDDARAAFKELIEGINLNADYQGAVWSRASETAFPVVGGYVDDAWDTQRRRGPDATERLTFVIA